MYENHILDETVERNISQLALTQTNVLLSDTPAIVAQHKIDNNTQDKVTKAHSEHTLIVTTITALSCPISLSPKFHAVGGTVENGQLFK